MNAFVSEVQRLIASDRLQEAGDKLAFASTGGPAALGDELAAWRAEFQQVQRQRRTDELPAADYAKQRKALAVRLLALARALAAPADVAGPTGASAFLSYNHADAQAAHEVRDALAAAGVVVRMDVDAMVPGTPIREFIRASIQSTTATVCVVSERSLLSGWVAQETALALSVLDLWGRRPFIACALDMRFLDADFRLAATERIDARLAEIEALLPRYAERRLDSNDLNGEKSRLFELRHQLGGILERLRASLCLDIRPPARAASLARLAAALRSAS